jgi:hypothetical protein
MAIRKKHRRKLTLNNRQFVWYVSDDYDSADMVLHVVSEDKKFIVNYHLEQPDSHRFLIVLGKEFPGFSDAGGRWIRVKCPKWEVDSIVTPSAVRHLIEWCLFEERELVRVNWKGEIIDEDSQ